jgi:hypothetical protein
MGADRAAGQGRDFRPHSSLRIAELPTGAAVGIEGWTRFCIPALNSSQGVSPDDRC